MTRRSAMNERYRKDAQVGSTRRSSASLKPKRAAGSGSGTTSRSKTASKPVYADPPEVKKWRRLWAILLGVALVPVAYVLGPNVVEWAHLGKGWIPNPAVARYGLFFEMAALAGALYIDFAIIRKIQMAARGGGTKTGKGAS